MTFQHQADNGFVALNQLVGDVFGYQRLQLRLFVRVGVAAVDHNIFTEPGLVQCGFTLSDMDAVVVGTGAPATKHNVSVSIPAGLEHRHLSLTVDAEESVWVAYGL